MVKWEVWYTYEGETLPCLQDADGVITQEQFTKKEASEVVKMMEKAWGHTGAIYEMRKVKHGT